MNEKALEQMAYQIQQALRQIVRNELEVSSIWVCSAENTAIRWFPGEIKDLLTLSYTHLKKGDTYNAVRTLQRANTIIDRIQENP